MSQPRLLFTRVPREDLFVDITSREDALKLYHTRYPLSLWHDTPDRVYLPVQRGQEREDALVWETSGPEIPHFMVLRLEDDQLFRFVVQQLRLIENEEELVRDWQTVEEYGLAKTELAQLTRRRQTITFLGPNGPQVVQQLIGR